MKKKFIIVMIILLLAVAMLAMSACTLREQESEVHKHAYGEWTITTDATCTLGGARERKCTGCIEKETETTDKIGHTPGADDGDCTTEVKCTRCAEIMTAATEHIPAADDDDCTTEVKCLDCNVVTTAATKHTASETWSSNSTNHWRECINIGCDGNAVDESEHTPAADDGDCGTEVRCTTCTKVTTPRKASHTAAQNWIRDVADHWKLCKNSGCTQIAVAKTAHTPAADDNDCTTEVKCTVCQGTAIASKQHATAQGWDTDGTHHWKKCINGDCNQHPVAKVPHTPVKDDDDCTTEVKCTVCQGTAIASKQHVAAKDWSKNDTQHWMECENSGCDKKAVAEEQHTPVDDDGNCTTEVKCTICPGTAIVAKVHVGESWSSDQTQHWMECENSGCDEIAVAKAAHTPADDDGNCTTEVKCTICHGTATLAKGHVGESWSHDGAQHWKECENIGCDGKVVEKIAHTPAADDKDCSTEAKCTTCAKVTTTAKQHVAAPDWSKDGTHHWRECTTVGCDGKAVAKTSHVMVGASNACECGYLDISIFTITNNVLTKCTPGAYTSITIPSGVTSIGTEAFWNCNKLTSIKIPEGVTRIGHSAINGCSELTSITIPSSVTYIDNYAFYGCSKLTSITIPSGVTYIGTAAFYGCSTLTSITIPSSVTYIGENAFAYCSKLTEIRFRPGVNTNGWHRSWNVHSFKIIQE